MKRSTLCRKNDCRNKKRSTGIRLNVFLLCTHFRQTIEIVGEIEDDFLKVPLSGVKVSILNPDSTVVVDSAKIVDFRNRIGKLLKVMFSGSS